MLALGPLAFASPWVLTALALLPALWFLLRVTPPAPRRISFPAVQLLLGLRPREETPARTPLWLLIMRLVLAALVILALAQPMLNPETRLAGDGPVILVVDNGWAVGPRWRTRQEAMRGLVERAAREGRGLLLLATAPAADGATPRASDLLGADAARKAVDALMPRPWPVDRVAARAALEPLRRHAPAHIVWLADGHGAPGTEAFAAALAELGPVILREDPPDAVAHLLRPPVTDGAGLTVRVERPLAWGEESVTVRMSGNGKLLARTELSFAADALTAEAAVVLQPEQRNELTRMEIEGEKSAAAVTLIDERWRRRPVGLVSGGGRETDQPLLSDLYYLERALDPYAEIRKGETVDLLKRDIAVIVLADVGRIVGAARDSLGDWIDGGGVLVRFAGPKLAAAPDDLVPVRLRGGGRALSGAMAWTQPAALAPFPDQGPFAGLAVPKDVLIQRQVLAEPSLDLGAKTWARLADGTPLVTAEQRGEGWLVLFHTTANADWSNLALSGLFVDMLRRIVDLSRGVAGAEAARSLAPYKSLDGFGRLGAPAATALPLSATAIAETVAQPRHPPGWYGTGDARRALNLGAGVDTAAALGKLPIAITREVFRDAREIDLKPWLLALAMLMILADTVIALALRGHLPLPMRGKAARASLAVLVAVAFWARADGAGAQVQDDRRAMEATIDTQLAFVRTGDRAIDRTSRQGLEGLSMVLRLRTAFEPGAAAGVDIEQDDIVFYPFLYWPISPAQPRLSSAAVAKIDRYLKNGGMILFDSRDAGTPGADGTGPAALRLRRLLERLDIPPLATVPRDHVLTRSFYLLNDFPGRWVGGGVWVEREQSRVRDVVSSVIIGGNDWADPCDMDDNVSVHAVVPGGERQREMAFRFGVNAVMYALTGNYKADQVHIPILLRRLGQ